VASLSIRKEGMPQSHGITLGRKEEKRGDGKVKDDSGLLAWAPG